jgi:hypothetical protein
MSTAHVLPQPKFLLGIRIAQLVVGITVLGLAAYGVTDFSFDGDSLMLFTVRPLPFSNTPLLPLLLTHTP